MKKLLLACAVLATALVCLAEAPEEKPFDPLLKQLGQWGGWDGSKQKPAPHLAVAHKREYKKMREAEPILAGATPAMPEEEHKLFESIGK